MELLPVLCENLVSTIVPVFNRSALLREAVESVLAQTYRPIEIIIVDDGSSDDTPQAIASLVSANPEVMRSLWIENAGPGAAREAGRLVAAGEFIQYLDSDDLLLPNKFALQVAGLTAHPHCSVAYGKTRNYSVGATPQDEAWKRTGERIETMFPSFLQSRWWDTSTPLYRRSVIDKAGPWLALRNEEDWEYDCRVASQGVRLHFSPEFVSDTRTHGGEMLSADGGTAPKLCHRAEAHREILGHAKRGGITLTSPEMRHFARELFLLARQCGAAQLHAEAKILFDLARSASTPERRSGFDFKLYGMASRLLGWQTTGRISAMIDRLRGIRRAR